MADQFQIPAEPQEDSATVVRAALNWLIGTGETYNLRLADRIDSDGDQTRAAEQILGERTSMRLMELLSAWEAQLTPPPKDAD